jgi:two-component system nitrate/nitrite response regulator NarL
MEANREQTRVLIVADDPLARAGLAAMLADQPDYTVVGQVGPEPDLADDISAYVPDVILWDLGWDPSPGRTPLLHPGNALPPILALLADDAQAADAWGSGAQGLLLREADGEKVAAALYAVAQGLVLIDPPLAPYLLPDRDREDDLLIEALTPREEDVLHLMADGLSNRAIALRLGISDHTVKFHVNAILGKLGAQSRTEAVVRATRLGLLIL